ncbi:hypothetical protein LMG28138_04582 [Pararobbsia alpina]|uniref:Transposase IS200-like domain-containing protein n=2 Tax=Pararobbsia alpina TaxID=621374 RepID=A0A6S7BHP8_9BURK|nr:hypothetical protein LMG28138_04582 [Pararobbsia alpina]
MLNELRGIFSEVFTQFDGEDGHVHLRANYPSKVSVHAPVKSLNDVSNRMTGKTNYPSSDASWGGGALGSTGTQSVLGRVHVMRLGRGNFAVHSRSSASAMRYRA